LAALLGSASCPARRATSPGAMAVAVGRPLWRHRRLRAWALPVLLCLSFCVLGPSAFCGGVGSATGLGWGSSSGSGRHGAQSGAEGRRLVIAGRAAEGDEKALSSEGFAGELGSFVLAVAVLPYVTISLYSSATLVTSGAGLPAGPSGIFGAAEGWATLVVFGVSIWSLVTAFQSRQEGLPELPLRIITGIKTLCALCVLVFATATVINVWVEPSDNPFRGLTLDMLTQPEKVQALASKTQNTALKYGAKVDLATKGQMEVLGKSLNEVQKKAEEAAAKVDEATKGQREELGKSLTEVQKKAEEAKKAAEEALAKSATFKAANKLKGAKDAAPAAESKAPEPEEAASKSTDLILD